MIESTAITNLVLVDAEFRQSDLCVCRRYNSLFFGNLSLADNCPQLRHNKNKGKAAELEIAELPRKQMQLTYLNPGKNGI